MGAMCQHPDVLKKLMVDYDKFAKDVGVIVPSGSIEAFQTVGQASDSQTEYLWKVKASELLIRTSYLVLHSLFFKIINYNDLSLTIVACEFPSSSAQLGLT
jgi:hypothetical protein